MQDKGCIDISGKTNKTAQLAKWKLPSIQDRASALIQSYCSVQVLGMAVTYQYVTLWHNHLHNHVHGKNKGVKKNSKCVHDCERLKPIGRERAGDIAFTGVHVSASSPSNCRLR